VARAWPIVGLKPGASAADNGRLIVTTRLLETLHYECLAREPSDVRGLHDMRIAVKRLRYSMEFFGRCFGDRYRRCLDGLKALQELLGDIHDADVLIAYLEERLEEAGKRHVVGVRALRDRTSARRADLHGALLAELDRLRGENAWQELVASLWR